MGCTHRCVLLLIILTFIIIYYCYIRNIGKILEKFEQGVKTSDYKIAILIISLNNDVDRFDCERAQWRKYMDKYKNIDCLIKMM